MLEWEERLEIWNWKQARTNQPKRNALESQWYEISHSLQTKASWSNLANERCAAGREWKARECVIKKGKNLNVVRNVQNKRPL